MTLTHLAIVMVVRKCATQTLNHVSWTLCSQTLMCMYSESDLLFDTFLGSLLRSLSKSPSGFVEYMGVGIVCLVELVGSCIQEG